MRTVSLRDFQREGAKALPSNEPTLLAGRGQEYLLLPMSPEMLDLAEGLIAVAALREDQAWAVSKGYDKVSMEAIDEEVRSIRKARNKKRSA
jgi:hypothetical protein